MAVLVYATALLAMLGISGAYNLWPVSSTKMGSLPHDRGDLHTVDQPGTGELSHNCLKRSAASRNKRSRSASRRRGGIPCGASGRPITLDLTLSSPPLTCAGREIATLSLGARRATSR